MAFVEILVNYFPSFCVALGETLKLTAVSLLCATVLGVIFGLFKVSGLKPLTVIANIYIDIIRGTPLMVQTMIVFYGISQVLRPYGFSWSNIGGNFTAGAVTLSLNAGAYMAEIIRGGIEAIDKGQMEAARSLGLPYGKAMQKVILPQAFRVMVPSIINQFIITLKDTSILSVIGYPELTNMGKTISGNTFKSLQTWAIIGILYMIVIITLSKIAKRIEQKIKIEDK